MWDFSALLARQMADHNRCLGGPPHVPQLHESALRYKLGLRLSQKLDLIQAHSFVKLERLARLPACASPLHSLSSPLPNP